MASTHPAPKRAALQFHRYAQGPQLTLAGSFGHTAALFVGSVLFPVDADGATQPSNIHQFGKFDPKDGQPERPPPLLRAFGDWPRRAFYIGVDGERDLLTLWRPQDKVWRRDTHRKGGGRRGDDHGQLVDAGLYVEGSLLSIRRTVGSKHGYTFQLSYNRGEVSATALSPGSMPTTHPSCATPLIPYRMLSFRSGEVFVLGIECASKAKGAARLAVQRWGRGAQSGVMAVLPAPLDTAVSAAEGDNVAFMGRRPNDMYVGTRGGVAHFDGRGWKLLQGVEVDGAQALAHGSDGALWTLHQGQLRRRMVQTGAWEGVPLPPSVEAVALADSHGIMPWVLIKAGHHNVLLGPPSQAAPVTMPSVAAANGAFDGLPAASSACATLFVPLRSGVTPGQSFEDVEQPISAAVAGVRYGVAQFGGERIFGAIPPDYLSGTNVVSASRRVDPTSIAKLRCYPAAAE